MASMTRAWDSNALQHYAFVGQRGSSRFPDQVLHHDGEPCPFLNVCSLLHPQPSSSAHHKY